MGDVVNRRQSHGWQRVCASAAIAALAAMSGCTSSKPARVVEAAPAAHEAAGNSAAASVAEIRTLDLREGAPEVFVDIESSAPLVWTSFRNAEGKVVIELPNAAPRAGLADLAPEDGLVSSLQVLRNEEGSRALTRLVIATRQEVEHSISADGNRLQIRLLPLEERAEEGGRIAFEPLGPDSPRAEEGNEAAPASESSDQAGLAVATTSESERESERAYSAPESAPSSGLAADLGTPDRPAVAPAPAGVAATRLDDIEVLTSEGGAVIRIAGDGEFPYSTFALTEPARFVIDLEGVVNRSSRSTMSVDGGIVERVRVAQFKPLPKPVSRVVFDLSRGVVPVIERTSDALVVSFGGSSVRRAVAVSPGSGPVPVPARTTTAVTPTREEPLVQVAQVPAVRETEPEVSDLALAQNTVRREPDIEVEEAEDTAAIAATATTPPPAPRGPATLEVRPTPARPATPMEVPATGGNLNAAIESFQTQTLGDTERTYVGEPIDLKVTNADVTDVLRTFAQISGLNIVVQPGVAGVVTAELENVPWDQALEQILKINGLGYEVEGNVMRIAPTAILRQEAQEKQQLAQAKALSIPLQTIYRRLSYANGDQIASLLKSGQGLLSQRGSVIVDQRTNSLIIKELPVFMDTIVSVIDRLDTPEPQVMIEARIIETTKRFSREFGIDWGFNGVASPANGNTTGLIFPNQGTVSGNVNTPGGGDAGQLNLRLGNVLNTFTLDVALQAAESEGLINILSAPKVATLNNQQASIQSGLQIPVQTIANNTVTVQYVAATLQLQVTPQVTAEGTVLMTINISKREPQLAFLIPGAANAPIATKEAQTRLLVRDGGTAVIGGIYRVSTDQGEDRVPGLANIPIIGNLFKNKSRREENEELLIFITPRIIKL